MTRYAMIFAACVALGALLGGCPKNVPQHASSGKDYRHQGAKPIPLEQGEGRVRDIVTYPGGDRVDWKVVQLPEGQQGDVRIRMRWQSPRPGLDLAFNVYDEWFEQVGQARPTPRGESRSKNTRIRGVSGKLYIQVYAPRRIDAGRYTLSVRFRERKPVVLPTLEELAGQISDPPPLPAVEEPRQKTPEEIAAEEEDRARRAEEQRLADEQRQADSDRLAELRRPIYARIRNTQRSSDGGVIITINAGRNRDVDRNWRGTLLRGNTQNPLPDGEFTIIRVTARESVAKVQLSLDQVKANPNVELRRDGI